MSIQCMWARDAKPERECAEALDSLVKLARALVERDLVTSGYVQQIGGGGDCAPMPPLIESGTYALVVAPSAVEAEYTTPEAFWNSGWELCEGEKVRLCVRGSGAVSGAAFLRAIQDQEWALARAAKPKRTRYYAPRVKPDEESIYRSGPPRLQTAGYDPNEGRLVLTGALRADEHIRGFEIFDIRQVLSAGKMGDGRPLREVHVIFSERSAAEREKRPLLDNDAQIFYLGESGELVEVKE
jgi:hypothetical protein